MRIRFTTPFAVSAALRASGRWRRAPLRRTTAELASPTNGPDEVCSVTSRVHIPKATQHFSYDLDGNLSTDGYYTFTYDSNNRLKTVSTNGVLILANFYDEKSRRVKKVTADAVITFFYDDWNLIEEHVAYTNGATSTIRYYWGKDLSGTLQGAGGVGGLLYLTVDNVIYIPCYDNNGNITHYLDSNGSTAAQYIYDTFGNLILQFGSLADFFRHRFSTKYFDAETSLYYYGYRFYHPILIRWLNRDSIGEDGGENLYGFCRNNVLTGIDVLGENRYITQFDILNYGGSGGTQLHVGVAVDRWVCRDGSWVKTGVTTFDFGVDASLGWRNTMWSVIGIAKGAIMERDGMHLKAPITLKSSPEQDLKMYNMIQKEIANPPFYNMLFHQCVFWSVGAVNYGM